MKMIIYQTISFVMYKVMKAMIWLQLKRNRLNKGLVMTVMKKDIIVMFMKKHNWMQRTNEWQLRQIKRMIDI